MDFEEKILKHYSLTKEGYLALCGSPSFSSLPDISSYPSVKKAISRLNEAKEKNEKVLVYGDYDCDGVMSASIILSALKEKGLKAEGYLPSRYLDGYGLNVENTRKSALKGFKLLFCTDNGVSAPEALGEAKKLGLEVIILDHHTMPQDSPDCYSLIHPSTIDSLDIPLSAGLLAFLFSKALLGREDPYLETLGGLSTLSDVMPLKGYNREAVRLMLANIVQYRYPEIFLLTSSEHLSYNDLQMEVIPKINAVGRLEKDASVNRLVKFFSRLDPLKAPAYATWLNEVNERRKLETKKAEETLSLALDEPALCVQASIPEGLNGLLAARLLNKYRRPIAVFSPKDGDPEVLVGSLRSQEGFNVLKALESLKVEKLAYGGHAFAAGVSIKKDDFPAFKKDFLFLSLKYRFSHPEEETIPLSIGEATLKNSHFLYALAPFGESFKAPAFALEDLDSSSFSYVKDGLYLSTKISDEAKIFSFSLGKSSFEEGEVVSLKVYFSPHFYRGRESLDLIAERE